ncbi:hypothetical protein ACFWP3_38645, partial [Streptomyces sp. NPDC058525]
MTTSLPPVAPEVLAEAVEQLSARLRKKLDAATASCGALASAGADGAVVLAFGEDAIVTLRPGPGGAVTEPGQATCTCLLSPRCLHRAAALGAAPLSDPPPYEAPLAAPDQTSGQAPDPASAPGQVPAPGHVPAPGPDPDPASGQAPDPASGPATGPA